MSGWSGDGNTKPTWRSCLHPDTIADRCVLCRARRVEGIQLAYVGRHAEPIGSHYLMPPKDIGTPIPPSPLNRVSPDAYNRSIRRVVPPPERKV